MKNDTKHTPGPWVVAGGTNKKGELFIWREERPSVVDCGAIATVLHHYPKELPANAALIAASPYMLSVLQELVALIGDPDGSTLDEAYDKAVAVIAKAKGGV